MLPILKNIVFFMNYFIIFAGTANGIVLISFSDCSCLIEVIFIFNLCLATLLNTFISSNTFLYSFASSAESSIFPFSLGAFSFFFLPNLPNCPDLQYNIE